VSVLVEQPGVLTTVQDLGRPGHQHEGVPVGGAMDDVALRLANLLAGNDPGAAALEATLVGPTLRFARATRIAVTGADVGWTVDGRPLPPWHAATVPAGGVVASGAARAGCRAYLAVAGGFDLPAVLGARATYAPAAMGGLAGRALRKGDVLPLAADPDLGRGQAGAAGAARAIAPSARPRYGETVRIILAPAAAALVPDARARLLERAFRVSPNSDRMGVRLEHDGEPLYLAAHFEPLSAGVAMGTVQLPSGGAPIILMADRQTTGGYPRLGEIATIDHPVVAQLRPGDRVRLAPVSLPDAQRLYLARERELVRLARVLLAPR